MRCGDQKVKGNLLIFKRNRTAEPKVLCGLYQCGDHKLKIVNLDGRAAEIVVNYDSVQNECNTEIPMNAGIGITWEKHSDTIIVTV